jgi:hypothetical protein
VQKFEISRHPKILELMEKRARYVREIKDNGYPTIKAATNTWWYERQKETQAEINTMKRQLSKKWLEKTIEEFHKTVHTIEVDQQLQGIRPADILTPPTIKYELEERATVAKLLFQPLDSLTEDQILDVRIELVENLVRLCKRRETPHQFKAPRPRGHPKTRRLGLGTDADSVNGDIFGDDTWGEAKCNAQPDVDWHAKTLVGQEPDPDVDSDADSMAAMELEEPPIVPVLYCAFCRWGDEEAGPRKREHIFSRVDSLGRHIRAQHLRPRAVGEGFGCPYRGCSAFLGNAEHFLGHTERQHGLRL